MDPGRFDALARSLTRHTAQRPTRRLLLHALGGGLLVAGLTASPDALARKRKRKRRRRCRGGTSKCDGLCVDLNSDPVNCGACGNRCAGGQTCTNGQCEGGCIPSCAGKECGGDGCGGACGPLGGECPTGQTCQDNGTCIDGGGSSCDPQCGFNQVCEGGACVAAPNRCSGPTGICNADPTPCGTSATGETCGCERTVEGNNVCINAGDNVCTGVSCNTSQDCRDTLGFHFYCQAAKTNAQGQFCGCGFGTATGRVCVPECDNPNVTFAASKRGATARRKRSRRG